jgi:signal transduction histidine kinase
MNTYLNWKMNHPLYGKHVSILSDASSALEGYIPSDYPFCISKEEMTYRQSWFGQVIDFFGASLLVNSSLASSNLYSDTISHVYMPCVASNTRLQSIRTEYYDPDLILIYHDFFEALYEDINESRARSMVYDTFTILLTSLQTLYDKAKILVMLPEEYGGAKQNAAVLAMKQAVKDHGVQCVQLHDGVDENETLLEQQKRIARDVIEALDAKALSFFEEEKKMEHEIETSLLAAQTSNLVQNHFAQRKSENKNEEEESLRIVLNVEHVEAPKKEEESENLSDVLKQYLDFEKEEKPEEEKFTIEL